ncbi:hypothetical protein [Virgisporangium aurantiacum]|uniref:Uncharacterized protein n=1 Tax=Virgisporangium aurantiacum TaxID=175570 RepID=A0A8J3ZN20_9ACTN|nr:hypothetical protein [Virgisporangium aurantiacum]GIJ64965.1 hypothetical protein Vau01_124810 [Virgisporangium aurantiacum]
MIVRTFTQTWNMRVRIYAFDDVRLPLRNGISIPQLVAGLIAAAVWVPLCALLGLGGLVGNAGVTVLLYVGPPILLMLQVDQPIAHEKKAEEWLTAIVARGQEPRALGAMAEAHPARPIVLTASRWIPDGGDGR